MIHTFLLTVFFVVALAAFLKRSHAYRHVCGVLMMLCGLAACTVGPFYKKPNVPAPAGWLETDTGATVVGPNAGTPQVAPVWPASQWWGGFKSPQLDDLMSEAQRANDDIAAAIARVLEADAQVRIAGAALFPSIEAIGDGTRERMKPPVPPGSPSVSYNQFTAELGASYELDFWGKNLAARRSAAFTAEATRYDRATVELTVMTSVATTYFQALESHDRLEVAEQNLATAQEVLKDLKTELSVGIVNALDVAQQETTVAALSASIPPLQQQFRQSVYALAVLVGRPPQALAFPGGTLTGLSEPQVRPGLPSELLVRRPDVASSEAQLRAANADIQQARAAFFPSIDLTADGGFMSTALTNLITPANRAFAITGGLTQQIFQGGALVGRYQQTKARYSELLADYHKTVLTAFSDVESALVALQQTADQYQREEEAVTTAQRAYDYTQTQLHAGTVNILTVLNTQTALFTAQDALVQVRFAHLQALVQLYSALGGGWQQTYDQKVPS